MQCAATPGDIPPVSDHGIRPVSSTKPVVRSVTMYELYLTAAYMLCLEFCSLVAEYHGQQSQDICGVNDVSCIVAIGAKAPVVC